VLYAVLRQALWRQFDVRLAGDAGAIANMVEERQGQPWEFEAGPLGDFERPNSGAYFEVWLDDGTLFVRSRSLGSAELRRPTESLDPILTSAQLPNGRTGRLYQARLLPRPDEEGPAIVSGRHVTVLVARDTLEVDRSLARLRWLLWGSALAALVLAVLASRFAVQTGLKPVKALVQQMDALGADRLAERLPVEGMPTELRPAVQKLNELLSRLEESFARERRFSADVSHELRTPIAGLRTILEVCSSRPRPLEEYERTLEEALGIIAQVSRLIENLLVLSRLEARQVRVSEADVGLRALVDECFAPLAAKARKRRLQFQNRIPADLTVSSDLDKLRMVAANLLDNAVEYTAAGGEITVDSDPARGSMLEVRDSGPSLPEATLRRVFDRFFRVDEARSDTGKHCGVGLALVRTLCESLGFSAEAENSPDGGLVFRVVVPSPSGRGSG